MHLGFPIPIMCRFSPTALQWGVVCYLPASTRWITLKLSYSLDGTPAYLSQLVVFFLTFIRLAGGSFLPSLLLGQRGKGETVPVPSSPFLLSRCDDTFWNLDWVEMDDIVWYHSIFILLSILSISIFHLNLKSCPHLLLLFTKRNCFSLVLHFLLVCLIIHEWIMSPLTGKFTSSLSALKLWSIAEKAHYYY